MTEKPIETRTMDEKLNRALDLLRNQWGPGLQDTWHRGRKNFRDFLYEKMGCSLLEAEEIVDALQINGKIRFGKKAENSRYGVWEIA